MKVLAELGFKQRPFKRRENTVMQTCIVAASGVALSGTIQTKTIVFSVYVDLVLVTKKGREMKDDDTVLQWRSLKLIMKLRE
ncbi:hypothetical protein CKAN_00722400 [Cinnamomum micranthum f. kanehirae]|uniref:Uncharacterized protein n=1 Tax=Cinnamomum micranthum f. kanehirae TaxID=337451 RepID=A0A443NJP6_9MAGN|nr:hypothetical protein CKAN_00722400 [Cinnamomum micranthum f. kanehirae]